MIRRSITDVATGILIIGLAGGLVAVANPSGTFAATNNQGGATHARAKQGGAGGVVATSMMIAGKGGMYTVTAINGQTITATANGIAFSVSTNDAGQAGGQVVVGGPDAGPPPPPGAKPGPGIVNTSPVTVTITVSSSTTYTRALHTASLSDVQVGSILNVEGTPSGTTINASKIEIVLPQHTGVVTAVSGNSLTVTGFDARTYTIAVGSDTLYERAGQTAALTDIAVGSLISAEGTPSSNGSTLNALGVTIQLPTVAGQVTAISGNTVTVQGPDGTTSTVLLTDSTTYSAGPSGTASKSSITTGSFIMAEGTVGSDGTLTALRVDVGTGKVMRQSGSGQDTGTSSSLSS